MDLYAEVVDRALFPLWESSVRGRPTLDILRHLEETQRRPLEELQALQLGALRRLLRHAYAHVPFYRARLDAARLQPTDIRTLEDLRRLPILGRDEVRGAGTSRASVTAPLPAIHKTTTGSSGSPLAISYDLGSEHWRQATRLRGYGWAGYRVGAKTMHYWGRQLPLPGLAGAKVYVDRLLRNERYVDCSARSDGDLELATKELKRAAPRVLVAFAQAAADLARFVNASRARTWPNIAVICAAERLLPSDREAIAEAFGPNVFETYGSREVMLIGAECEAHDGLHLSMENLLVELVVREHGGPRPAEEGETGEVVLTDLHNYGMPLIRYASGDLAVSRGRAPCPCGRTLARIGPIEGRVTETLVDGDGGKVAGLLFIVAMVGLGQSCEAFQVVQHHDRSVTVRVSGNHLAAEAEARLRARVTPYLRGLPLRIERVDELPLDPSGKRRPVIVERGA